MGSEMCIRDSWWTTNWVGSESWEGAVDVDGYFEGEGVLSVGYCIGQDGFREGLERVEGMWFARRLEGKATFYHNDQTDVVHMVSRLQHGVALKFEDQEKQHLIGITLYKDGKDVDLSGISPWARSG